MHMCIPSYLMYVYILLTKLFTLPLFYTTSDLKKRKEYWDNKLALSVMIINYQVLTRLFQVYTRGIHKARCYYMKCA